MLDTAFALDRSDAPAGAPVAIDSAALREECLARAGVYRLLAGAFVEEPGPAFIAAVRDAQSLAHLAAAGIRFDADFLVEDESRLAEILACEFTTLFASSGGFPPIESVRLTGRFKQEPCFQVERIYAAAGFRLAKGRFELFPDQLGVELLFVAELLDACAAALGTEQLQEYRRLEKSIKRFWSQHLGRWVRGYSRLIERAAAHSFYREMARFLGGFAEEEIAAMQLKNLDDLDFGRAVVPKSEIKVEFNPDEPVCGACPSGAAASAPRTQTLHDLRP